MKYLAGVPVISNVNIYYELETYQMGLPLGETSKLNLCDSQYPYRVTKSLYVFSDICGSLTELSGLSVYPHIVMQCRSQMAQMSLCGLPLKPKKQLANISLNDFAVFSGSF